MVAFWISSALALLSRSVFCLYRPVPWRLRLALQCALCVRDTHTHNCSPTHSYDNPSRFEALTRYLPKGHGGQHLSKNSPHEHLENPVTRKAHKNKKALVTLLAPREWMGSFCSQREPKHRLLREPISHLWRTAGQQVQFLFLSFVLSC